MTSQTRTRMLLVIFCFAAWAMPGCGDMPAPFQREKKTVRSDRDAPFDPEKNYPDWAYDSPSYMKPVAEPVAEAGAREGDPPHYFTNQKLVEIRQPSSYNNEEIPQVAIWWTNDNGFHWQKAGYFGRGQSFFPFEMEEDGDYGIRFVGPNQEPAVNTPAYPERVYHLDTTLPDVEINIEPEQAQYEIGQKVTISWKARDYHLPENNVAIQMILDYGAKEPRVLELQRGLANDGSITYEIAADAANHYLRFRAGACDRANNLGLAYSAAMQVVNQLPQEATTETANEKPLEVSSVVPEYSGETQKSDTAQPMALTGETSPSPNKIAPPKTETSTSPQNTGMTATSESEEEIIASAEAELLGNEPATESKATTDAQSIMTVPAPTETPMGPMMETNPEPVGEDDSKANAINDCPPVAPVNVETDRILPASSRKFSMLPADEEVSEPAPAEKAANTKEEETSDTAIVKNEDADDANNKPAATDSEPVNNQTPEINVQKSSAENLGLAQRGPVNPVDLTHGNGLLIPLPATVDQIKPSTRLATIHPWRLLGEVFNSPLQTVWVLPRVRAGYEFARMLEGRLLADNPLLRAVAEPGSAATDVAKRLDLENPDESINNP